MKTLMSVIILGSSFSAIANEEPDTLVSSENASPDTEIVSENEVPDSVVIPENTDGDLFYNYAGLGLNSDVQVDSDSIDWAIGLDLKAGYSINSILFTKVQTRSAAVIDIISGDDGVKNTYNFQLGARHTTDIVDPFATAELEFNNLDTTSEEAVWMSLGTQLGAKVKLNLFDVLGGSLSGAYLIGLTNVNQELGVYQGYSADVELMLFKVLSGYYEISAKLSGEPNNDDVLEANRGSIQSAIGLKFHY